MAYMDVINSVIRGVSLVLHDLYPDITIYDYYPEQNFDMPSFIIEEVSTVKDRRIGLKGTKDRQGNGVRNINFSYLHIIFNSTDQRQIRQVTENVELALDEIMLEDGYQIHCYAVASYINQGYSLISFRVRYTTWILPKDYPRMEELELQERLYSKQ